jgi:hypothetical protein
MAMCRYVRDPHGGIMMGRISSVLLFLIVSAYSQSAIAQSNNDVTSANYLVPGCREFLKAQSDQYSYRQGVCAGIVSAMQYFGEPLGYCSPDGTNVGQAMRVIVTYIDQRPSQMHTQFRDLALRALRAAWPCKKTVRMQRTRPHRAPHDDPPRRNPY